jgi:hypothetical protein
MFAFPGLMGNEVLQKWRMVFSRYDERNDYNKCVEVRGEGFDT